MGKPLFVRVKDPSTGHEFDVREDSFLLQRGLVKPVKEKRYQPSPVRRRAKFHVDLAASVRQTPEASAKGIEPVEKEPEHG